MRLVPLPEQRRRLRASSADDAEGAPLSSFTSPEPSAGKVLRLRGLATHTDPKIRESAALACLTPTEVLVDLAGDDDLGVRICVARNERTPTEALRQLARDPSAGLRGWVAANPAVPADVLDLLTDDPSRTVRDLVVWARRWPDQRRTR